MKLPRRCRAFYPAAAGLHVARVAVNMFSGIGSEVMIHGREFYQSSAGKLSLRQDPVSSSSRPTIVLEPIFVRPNRASRTLPPVGLLVQGCSV